MFFLLVICFSSFCQSSTKENFGKWEFSGSGLINKVAIIEERFSSQSFKGLTPGFAFSASYKARKALHELSASYESGRLETNSSPTRELSQRIVNIDYINLYRIFGSEGNSFHGKAGGAIQFLYAKRDFKDFINNHQSFEAMTSLGIVVELEYFITQDPNGFRLTNRLVLPVVFSYAQPLYSGSVPNDKKMVSQYFENNQWAVIPECFRIKNRCGLAKAFNIRHSFLLSYTWDYYQLNTSRSVQQSKHQLGLTYGYKL